MINRKQIDSVASRLRPASLWLACLTVMVVAGPLLAQNGPDNDPDGLRGYVDNIFHQPSVDSVNLYNGVLTIPIRLGPAYPIGPKLKFQLMMTYSSRDFDFGHPLTVSDFTYLPMSFDPALGDGWTFTLGAIKDCVKGWCYVASDGSQHLFSPIATAHYYKTTDGARLMLHDTGGSGGPWEMWDEDGNHYTFDATGHVTGNDDSLTGLPNGYTHAFGRGRDGWYLTALEDPFHNAVSVSYWSGVTPCLTYNPPNGCSDLRMKCPATASWIPHFINLPSGQIVVGVINNQITSFTFPVFANNAATTAIWNLHYESNLPPPAPFCDDGSSYSVAVPKLTAIDLPGGAGSYKFDFGLACDSDLRMTLPTLATIDYAFAQWSFFHGRISALDQNCMPKGPDPLALAEQSASRVCGAAPEPPLPLLSTRGCTDSTEGRWLDQQQGVVLRKETVNGQVNTTTYTQFAFPFGENGTSPTSNCDGEARCGPESLTIVSMPPDVDGRVRAKGLLFWSGPKSNAAGAPTYAGDRTGADIEERTFELDPMSDPLHHVDISGFPVCGGSRDNPFCANHAVRVAQRTYEYDIPTMDIGNRRLQAESTLYSPVLANDVCATSPPCVSHTVSFSPTGSTWETNGRHYSTESHSGTLGGDSRAITTTWAPVNWNTPPASGSFSLPDVLTERFTSDGSALNVDQHFYFDSTNGFLQGIETWEDSGHTRFLADCRYSDTGGDVQYRITATITNGSLVPCFPTFGSWSQGAIGTNNDAFATYSTYQNGGLLTRSWINAGSIAPWHTTDYTRDAATGWITFSRDSAGQQAAYVYDSLGRPTSITPPGETPIVVTYPNPNQTTATRTGTGGLSTSEEYDYDGLGRTTRHSRLMADGSTSKQFTLFDGRGNSYFQSEWVDSGTSETLTPNISTSCVTSGTPYNTFRPSAAPGTYRLCFDPFDRPQQVSGSKGSSLLTVSRVNGASFYSDTKEATTTSCVNGARADPSCTGGTPSTTTLTKDAFGRVTNVMEPTGDQTTYTYDVNDKLTSVSPGSLNARTFTYDSTGFLRAESTPEKGLVTYDGIGSIGNVQQRTEGGVVLSFYDEFGERLSCQVAGAFPVGGNCASSGITLYAQNVYDEAGHGFANGKLTRRIGYNPTSASQPVATESFTYSGTGGRPSQKDVTLTGTPKGTQTWTQTWTYNSLGLLSTHTDPHLAADAAVTSTLGYSNGAPTSLSAPGSVVSGATYNPAGGLSAWTAGNTVVTTITQDASKLPRPSEIKAAAGATTLFDKVYSYDGAGNIRQIGSDVFGYDSLSRLTSSTVSGIPLLYSYDRWGNLNPSIIENPNHTNHLNSSNGSYDSRGNLVATIGQGTGGQAHTYDAFSRQTALNNAQERYLYDGASERIARVGATAKYYTIVPPCRLFDSRSGSPIGSTQVMLQTTGACGVPSGAISVTGNLTAVPQTQAGALILAPGGVLAITQSLDFNANIVRANNFTMQLNSLGQLGVSTTGVTSHAIVDITGYYLVPPGTETWTATLRDEADRLAADYSITSASATRLKDYFHFGNLLVATRDSAGNFFYDVSDHLGTPRVVTDANHNVSETHSYQPYGTEIAGSFGIQPLKFATMERDAVSGNDYDHARHISPTLGRFLSPDKLQGRVAGPQTWNRYVYLAGDLRTVVAAG